MFFISLVLTTLCISSVATVPSKALALEASVSVNTQQLLPLGGNTCAALSVTSFTPYIYDGALHSFEFTITDPSYVAIFGTVGDTSLSFEKLTRRVLPSGAIQIHADIDTTPIKGTLLIHVTLLSAPTAQPVCVGVVSTGVGSGPVQSTPPAPSTPVVPIVKPTTTQQTQQTSPSTTTSPLSSATSSGTSTATSVTPVLNTMQDALNTLCVSEASAYRLWLILLVLFVLIVGAALWAEFPMSVSWARTPERIATLILVLLLLLLGFWYFSATCRAALWMPLVAFLIAILGLLAAFWNHPRVTQLLLSQNVKK